MSEPKVGEVFFFDGRKLKCILSKERGICDKCFFRDKNCLPYPCEAYDRDDGKEVIFVEVDDAKKS